MVRRVAMSGRRRRPSGPNLAITEHVNDECVEEPFIERLALGVAIREPVQSRHRPRSHPGEQVALGISLAIVDALGSAMTFWGSLYVFGLQSAIAATCSSDWGDVRAGRACRKTTTDDAVFAARRDQWLSR